MDREKFTVKRLTWGGARGTEFYGPKLTSFLLALANFYGGELGA